MYNWISHAEKMCFSPEPVMCIRPIPNILVLVLVEPKTYARENNI